MPWFGLKRRKQLSKDLHGLLNELSNADDIPRKVEICRAAPMLTSRDERPRLWATLHVQLAHNPLGDRGKNLEQAVTHLHQALDVHALFRVTNLLQYRGNLK